MPAFDLIREVISVAQNPNTIDRRAALEAFLHRLSSTELRGLVAVMRSGRGDKPDVSRMLQTTRHELQHRNIAILQLLDEEWLALRLMEGVELAQQDGMNLDRLFGPHSSSSSSDRVNASSN